MNELITTDNIIYKTFANLIFSLYPKKFIYSGKYWFALNKYNIYQKYTDIRFILSELIDIDLINLVEKYCLDIINEPNLTVDKINDIDRIRSKIIMKLRTNIVRNQINKELYILYFDKNVLKRFEQNPYLFAFNNGVYDILEKRFRLPTNEEYILFTSGYDYNVPDKKYIDELNEIIDDIFPNPIEKKNALKLLSTSLVGNNTNKKILYLIGSGANGKSTILRLLSFVLGKYSEEVRVNDFNIQNILLFATLCDKRWINLYDEQNYTFENWFNRLSGDDVTKLMGNKEIVARNLYENDFEYFAKFKLCCTSDHKPNIINVPKRINDYVRYINFPTKFVSNPSAPNEKKIDRQLPNRIFKKIEYRHAFFSILLEYLDMEINCL